MKDISSDSISYEDYKKNEDDSKNDTPQPQASLLWRLGAGMVNTTKGAVGASVGLGVGAVKLVANTSYGVVSKTAEVGITASKAVANTGYNAMSGGVGVVTGGVSAVTSRLPIPTLTKGKDKKD